MLVTTFLVTARRVGDISIDNITTVSSQAFGHSENESKNIFSLSAKDFDDRERCLKLQSYHKFIHSHTDCIKKSEYATFR